MAVLSLLAGVDDAEFTYLRDRIGTTDGNLSVHLAKLEKARYVEVIKEFVDRKPRSRYRMTPRGRAAFLEYLENLRSLLGGKL